MVICIQRFHIRQPSNPVRTTSGSTLSLTTSLKNTDNSARLSVIPAKAGIQCFHPFLVVPAKAGTQRALIRDFFFTVFARTALAGRSNLIKVRESTSLVSNVLNAPTRCHTREGGYPVLIFRSFFLMSYLRRHVSIAFIPSLRSEAIFRVACPACPDMLLLIAFFPNLFSLFNLL